MKFIFYFFLSLLLLISCQTKQKKSQADIQRIVSLSPNITEIVYALGQEDKLIAVSDYCLYPPETNEKERIGGLLNPNLEKMYSFQADLFLGTPAHYDLSQKLAEQDLQSVLLPNDRLEDIFSSIDSLGKLLNCQERAKKLNQSIRDSLSHYYSLAQNLKETPSALFVIGREPGSTRKITACGSGTFINKIWQKMGGSNAFTNLPVKYAQVNREALIKKSPNVIIEFKFLQEWDDTQDRVNKMEWLQLENLDAVQREQIYVLTGDYTLIPGPRIYFLARDYYHILQKYHKTKHIKY